MIKGKSPKVKELVDLTQLLASIFNLTPKRQMSCGGLKRHPVTQL
jgi:hypothetical protein